MAETRQRTLVLIKPGGVQGGLIGLIIQRFERKGLKLVALKQVWASEELIRQHYSSLAAMPYFPSLVKYMSSSPVVAMVWEGVNAVKTVRVMIGAATCAMEGPDDPQPGTIRGDYSLQTGHGSIIHAADSIDAASREVYLWFTEKELIDWTSAVQSTFEY